MIKIEFQSHGKANLLRLENEAGLCLLLSEIGAGVRDVVYDGRVMTASPRDVDLYLSDHDGFYGKIIAPLAGRFEKGEVHGKTGIAHLPVDPKTGYALHSESMNLAFAKWSSRLEDDKSGLKAIFELHKEGKGDFPACLYRVTYFLSRAEARFSISMEAFPEGDMPFNMTSHLYFSLGEKNVLGARMALQSSEVTSYAPNLLPSGKIPVTGAMDFQKMRKVAEALPCKENEAMHGLDHAFYLLKKNPSAVLESKRVRLEIKTDAPTLTVYSKIYPRKGLPLSSGFLDQQYGSLTFEPTGDLLAPETLWVKGGGHYSRYISYSFSPIGEQR